MNTRVTVAKESGGDFVLADYGDVILENPYVEPDFDAQVLKFFRGTEVRIVDRMNESTVWTFNLMKSWASHKDAVSWDLDVRSNCPRVGTVAMQVKTLSTATVSRWLKDAAVKVKSLPRIGLATFTSVTIIGGKPLLSQPKDS